MDCWIWKHIGLIDEDVRFERTERWLPKERRFVTGLAGIHGLDGLPQSTK